MMQVTAADDNLIQTQGKELDGLDAEVVTPTDDADADIAAKAAALEVRSIAKCFAYVLLQSAVLSVMPHASMTAQSWVRSSVISRHGCAHNAGRAGACQGCKCRPLALQSRRVARQCSRSC